MVLEIPSGLADERCDEMSTFKSPPAPPKFSSSLYFSACSSHSHFVHTVL